MQYLTVKHCDGITGLEELFSAAGQVHTRGVQSFDVKQAQSSAASQSIQAARNRAVTCCPFTLLVLISSTLKSRITMS